MAVVELIDIPALTRLYDMWTGRLVRSTARPRADCIAAVAALLEVLLFDTLPGLLIGISVSMLLLYRASGPHIATLGRVVGETGDTLGRRRPTPGEPPSTRYR